MPRAILEKLGQAQGPEWTLLILHGHCKKDTFFTQAPHLNPDSSVKCNFGKVWGKAKGLIQH